MTTELALPEKNQAGMDALSRATALAIRTNEDYTRADTLAVALKELEKEVDKTFDEHIEAAYANHKSLVAKKKKFSEPLVEARRIIKAKMSEWNERMEALRRQEEARLQEQARKLAEEEALSQAQLAEDAGDHETAQAIIEQPIQAPTVVLSKSVPKTATVLRKIKKFRFIDKSKVKPQFLIPDEIKIGQVVRTMGFDAAAFVGGIEVFEIVA